MGTVNEQLDCCLGFLCGLSFVLMVLNQHVYSHIRGFCDVCFLLTQFSNIMYFPQKCCTSKKKYIYTTMDKNPCFGGFDLARI